MAFLQIGGALVGGLAYGLAGYFSSHKEDFEGWKFVKPSVYAMILAGLASVSGMDAGAVAGGSVSALLGVILDKAYVAVRARFS